MTLSRFRRPIALAIVSGLGLAGTATAQTVAVRGLPPGSTAELAQGTAVVSANADAAGDATLTGNLSDPAGVRVNLYVDTCESSRRVVIVERDAAVPPAGAGCARAAIPGLFVVRPVSTLVINLSDANPTVLLRQGPFDFRRVQRSGIEPAEGLMIFGGGGWSRLHEAKGTSCGNIPECPGSDSGFGFGGGIGFWLTQYAGIEASYYKPAKSLFEGATNNSLFQTTIEPHVLMFTAKLAVPVGPVRIFGQGGATYHRSTIATRQDSADQIEDRFEMRTAGWGWTFGGGIETWLSNSVALYVEGGHAALKGPGVETGGEGRLDERMTFALAGLRVNLNR